MAEKNPEKDVIKLSKSLFRKPIHGHKGKEAWGVFDPKNKRTVYERIIII